MTATGRTRANGNRTKTQILDAAETLFGQRGFDQVSLRDITDKANVTLALSSYHFKTKANLFEAVVARRAKLLCDMRADRLAALPPTASVRDILDAFMAPLFEQVQSGDVGWASYTQLLPRLGEGDRWLDILHKHFDPTFDLFQARLAQVVTESEAHELTRGAVMTIQLMLATVSGHRRLDRLTKGAAQAQDFDAAYETLLTYCTAGVTALSR